MTATEFRNRYQGFRSYNPIAVVGLVLLQIVLGLPFGIVRGLYIGIRDAVVDAVSSVGQCYCFLRDWRRVEGGER